MQREIKNILQNEIDPAYVKRATFVFESIEKAKPSKVLDAGCGRGFYVKSLSYYSFINEIHGVEINNEYLKKAKKTCKDKRISLQLGSIYKLPYKDNYFDAIICSEVLEHLSDENLALQELKRVLKRNGCLIVTVPNYHFPLLWDPINWLLMKTLNTHVPKNIWWLAGLWADHERLYTQDQLLRLLKKYFSVMQIKPLTHWSWPFAHFFLYGIGKNIIERCNVDTFNRFTFSDRKSISSILAKIVALPSELDKSFPSRKSVNIVALAEKRA